MKKTINVRDGECFSSHCSKAESFLLVSIEYGVFPMSNELETVTKAKYNFLVS